MVVRSDNILLAKRGEIINYSKCKILIRRMNDSKNWIYSDKGMNTKRGCGVTVVLDFEI